MIVMRVKGPPVDTLYCVVPPTLLVVFELDHYTFLWPVLVGCYAEI